MYKKLSRIGYQVLVGGTKKNLNKKAKRILDSGDGIFVVELYFPNNLTLYELQNGECFYCGSHMDLEEGVTRDHFFPKSLSWRNKSLFGNMVLACRECNERKGSLPPGKGKIAKFFDLHRADILSSPEWW